MSLDSPSDFKEAFDTAKQFTSKDHLDDLLIDRFHHRYTVAILIYFCIGLSTYQYLGDPIQCWVPAQFTDNYEEYTNRLCYLQNTYHIPKSHSVPSTSQLRRQRTLKYYQWIHFVLLLQALFFAFPRIIWQLFNEKFGFSLRNFVDVANRYESFETIGEQKSVIDYIVDQLQRHDEIIQGRRFQDRRLICFYLFIKGLYIFNVVVQMLFLQYFLSYDDINYIHYGVHVLRHLLIDFSLPESELFPRITLCDFRIRELGEQHQYTVECILVINLFIEKLYFFLWIWFFVLFLVTVIDFFRLIYQIFLRDSRHSFCNDHLDLLVKNFNRYENSFQRWIDGISVDNVFVVRILSSNTNSILVGEILQELFQRTRRDNSQL